MQPDDAPWVPFTPAEAAERLVGLDVPWAVAAGHAIDLFVGERTREHEDLEIAVPAERFAEVAERFELEWHVPVGEGRLARLDGPLEQLESHQTWGLEPAVPAWRIDVFREPSADGMWVSRRDEALRLPYSELIERTECGIPYLRPEVALLFKAKAAREKDEHDLAVVLPLLSRERRALLAGWLERVHPGHAWVGRLSPSE